LTDGGVIVQQSPVNKIRSRDDFLPAKATYQGKEYVIERQPTDKEYDDMLFGWKVEQGITSNSVIYVKDGVTVGIGTGEQDRVGVAEIAVFKAYTKHADALCFRKYGIPYKTFDLDVQNGKRNRLDLIKIDVDTRSIKEALSDLQWYLTAFFPFRDGVDVGIKEGVTAIVTPAVLQRDFESIIACNEREPESYHGLHRPEGV